MDGVVDAGTGLIVVGCTNRPEVLDSALLRPGRFDSILYVGPGDAAARAQTFKIHSKKSALASDVDFDELARLTERCTGAEIMGVCREATYMALRENAEAEEVAQRHFLQALDDTRAPMHTQEQLDKFASFNRKDKACADFDYEAWKPPRFKAQEAKAKEEEDDEAFKKNPPTRPSFQNPTKRHTDEDDGFMDSDSESDGEHDPDSAAGAQGGGAAE